MTWRRMARWSVPGMAILAIASCGRAVDHGDGTGTTSSQQVGTVVGVFGSDGGPAPGGFHSFSSGIVRLRDREHIYSTAISPVGHFTIKAMPGTYQVTGTGPQGDTCGSGTVTVQRLRTTSVTVACQIP
jgi:hypothetical protein